MLADINFYDYGAQPNCNLALRSFCQAKLTLHGRDWQVGIVQANWNRSGSSADGRLLLRPWEQRDQPFNTYNASLATVNFSRNLFLDGHAWQLERIAQSQNGEARSALQFTEQSVPLGELEITGQFIQRLVVTGGPYAVILDQPARVVKIPTGTYNQFDIQLEKNGAEVFSKFDRSQFGGRISVDAKTRAVLNRGGPLTNSVLASRHGRELNLDYQLLGAGGEVYQPANQDRSKPPAFAVFKAGKKIASGTFEFG